MIYKYELDIPAQTLKSDPEIKLIKLPKGTITQVDICFPDGCFGLAKAKVDHAESQIFPSNPEAWFSWNNYCISFREDYKLSENFNLLKLKGYNDDDSYSHAITFRFGVTGSWKYALDQFIKTVVSI